MTAAERLIQGVLDQIEGGFDEAGCPLTAEQLAFLASVKERSADAFSKERAA